MLKDLTIRKSFKEDSAHRDAYHVRVATPKRFGVDARTTQVWPNEKTQLDKNSKSYVAPAGCQDALDQKLVAGRLETSRIPLYTPG